MALSLGGRTYDPDDPMGKMFFNSLATFAEFEVDLIRMRTREGMAVAREGKLKGRQPKLSPKQQRELKRMHEIGECTISECTISDLGELFSVSRPTVYRTIRRATAAHLNACQENIAVASVRWGSTSETPLSHQSRYVTGDASRPDGVRHLRRRLAPSLR